MVCDGQVSLALVLCPRIPRNPPPSCCHHLENILLLTFICCLFKGFYLFIFRERGGEKEREGKIVVREKHPSVASHMCADWALNLQPRDMSWPGIKLVSFPFTGQCPTHWATLVRAFCCFFTFLFFFFLLILTQGYAYWFSREGKGGKERGIETSIREKNIYWLPPAHAPTRNQTHDPLVQPTQLHWPGHLPTFL